MNTTELKKIWESVYSLEALVVKEDCRWEDRAREN
jgi:hypothetical protein